MDSLLQSHKQSEDFLKASGNCQEQQNQKMSVISKSMQPDEAQKPLIKTKCSYSKLINDSSETNSTFQLQHLNSLNSQIQGALAQGDNEAKNDKEQNEQKQISSGKKRFIDFMKAPIPKKKISSSGLKIQIPQSPIPVSDADEISSISLIRKQSAKIGTQEPQAEQLQEKMKQQPSQESSGRTTQSQILKVPSYSAMSVAESATLQKKTPTGTLQQSTSNSALRLTRQHKSPLLEQMLASQSAVSTNIQNGERALQVYRPNCQSTKNLPSVSIAKLQGCVPPTAAQSNETNQTQLINYTSAPLKETNKNNHLPPASKHHQQSRSQSGVRQTSCSNDSVRQDIQANKASSPLAQYANYAFQPACKILLPPKLTYEASKTSVRRNGVVRGYAANTHQGLVRNYNEDRVSIILNISEPQSRKKQSPTSGENSPWPVCSFFGIYDGHGGSQCADFLRDNLHTHVVREACFPDDPREALKIGFAKAEQRWIEEFATTKASDGSTVIVDRSGSCAIVVLIIEEMCYIANVGDSRAVLSGDGGTRTYSLSRDHKPSDEHEKQRILNAGGKIYSRSIPASTKNQLPNRNAQMIESQGNVSTNLQQKTHFVGPVRIFPGRLSVSRSFGDVEAKLPELGGNPNVLIAIPEIKAFRIKKEYDFIALGCDGIFDRINNKEAVQVIWNCTNDLSRFYPDIKNIHQLTGLGVDYLVKNSLLRRSLDNVTAVIISFRNFKHVVLGEDGNMIPAANQRGQERPKTTKAVPQASDMKITNPANAGSRQEVSAKLDHRSNSLEMNKRKQTKIELDKEKVSAQKNFCQQHASNIRIPMSLNTSNGQKNLSSDSLNAKKSHSITCKDKMPSQANLLEQKRLTRQKNTESSLPAQKQDFVLKSKFLTDTASSSSKTMLQRINAQSTPNIGLNFLKKPSKPRFFKFDDDYESDKDQDKAE